MKLHVDLETLELIEAPGVRHPVPSIRVKRGDQVRLEVVFLRDGVNPEIIGSPDSLEIRFGVKRLGGLSGDLLVHSAAWELPPANSENPVYFCAPDFHTIQIHDEFLRRTDPATGNEPNEITLVGEITWRIGTASPTSTRSFLVVVENDVVRGNEGLPVPAMPAYPAPESLLTTGHLAATDPHNQYLKQPFQTNVPMQFVAGQWWPAVHFGEPANRVVHSFFALIAGTGSAVLRVDALPGQLELVTFITPQDVGAELTAHAEDTTLIVSLATDGQAGEPDLTPGGPNALANLAAAFELLGLTTALTGDGQEPVACLDAPFHPDATDGTPGWLGKIAIDAPRIWICTKHDLTPANDGWAELNVIQPDPPAEPSAP